MRIEYIAIKDLADFLESDVFQKMPVLPISPRRGWSQVNNPRAQPEDIALVLGYIENKMVGYFGFLSDDIVYGGEKIHVGWASGFWVDPNERGKGIGRTLINKGFEAWDYKFVITDFTNVSGPLFKSTGLVDELKTNNGLRCYLRFNFAKLLPTSRPKLKPWTPLLKINDFVLNTVNSLRLIFFQKSLDKKYELKFSKKINAASFNFIQSKNKNEFFRRNLNSLPWILNHPWIGSTAEDQAEDQRYYFSVYAEHFRKQVLTIKERGIIKAVVILLERDDALKTPYCWIEKGFESVVAKAIWQYMIRERLGYLTVYQKGLAEALRSSGSPFYLKRPFQRHYLISNRIDKSIIPEEIVLQDGDGDCGFT